MRAVLIGLVVIVVLVLLGRYLTRPHPVTVVVTTATRGSVEATVSNTRAGTVEACRRARLAPPIGGQILELATNEGQLVEQGQVLLSLWNVDRAAEVELATRDAGAVRARAEEACTVADVAEREAERNRKLRERGLTSEEIADRTAGDAQARAASCRAARAAVRVADARIDVARAALERTVLRAPFDGTVAEINGEVGEFITPSPVGIPTPPAVDLIDNSCLLISAPIDEVDAPAVQAGQPARVSLDAFSERFSGTVRRVAPYVLDLEKQARTVEIEVELDAPDPALLPGYSADVEVILERRENVLRIPTQALAGESRVLVYLPESGTLEERAVETGLSNWAHTEIVSGLSAGDQVVTSLDREGVEAGAAVELE